MVLPWNGRPSDELSSHFTRSGTGFLVNAVVERTMRVVAPIVAGGLLLAVWFLLVDVARVLPPSVPSPNAIIAQFGENFGIIVNATRITASNAALGLLIGAIIAIVLASLAALVRPLDGMGAPIVAAIAVVPIVALTPIFNTMFGASAQTGRVLIAAIASFVPVYINVLRGLRQARPVQRDLFLAYAATKPQTFRRLTLPMALPFLVTGIRIASSIAVISALVAEYFGGPADGLGTAIASYAKSGKSALAWAFVFASIIVGLVFFLVTLLLERIVRRYRAEH